MVATRSKRIWETIGIAIIVVAMILVAFWGGTQLYENRQWDPLGEYPIQVVEVVPRNNELRSIIDENANFITGDSATTPVFFWDEEITNSGVKCVKDATDNADIPEDGIINIRGELSWVLNNPPGSIIKVGEGSNTRGPGCQQYSFSNPIPDEIRERMEELKARGIGASEWAITGVETPIRELNPEACDPNEPQNCDTEEGVSRSWRTTSFTVIHQDHPECDGTGPHDGTRPNCGATNE